MDDSPTHLQVLRVIETEQADSNQLVDKRNDVFVVAALHLVDENVLLLLLQPFILTSNKMESLQKRPTRRSLRTPGSFSSKRG